MYLQLLGSPERNQSCTDATHSHIIYMRSAHKYATKPCDIITFGRVLISFATICPQKCTFYAIGLSWSFESARVCNHLRTDAQASFWSNARQGRYE